MGTWGPALFSDDTACDVRDGYRDLLGEGVFAESPKMSHGIDQVADNIEAAVAYLRRRGILVPL